MVGRCCCLRLASLTFIARVGFSTGTLACTLDSLVRVSRRVGKDHFDRIAQSTSSRRSTDTPRLNCKQPQVWKASVVLPLHPASQRRTSNRNSAFPVPRRRIHLYRFLLNGFRSFDSLSKVLFIFPSQYLFAIGFPHIFSLRRSLSPT